jgi:lysophospholipase L1-like esterase
MVFELVEYSERIYTATKIKYNYQQVEDSIREYAKKSTGKYINSYNEYEDEKNNKKFEYLNDWIENEGEKIKRDIENK